MTSYRIIAHGPGRSFPRGETATDQFLAAATDSGQVTIHLGGGYQPDDQAVAVLVELNNESLGFHTGEQSGTEGGNTLGFNRFRNGNDAPSTLIELVYQPGTSDQAIEAARSVFEGAGFEVALCSDQPGRIIDRLVRPKYNAALRFLDEGLATAHDMDRTCRMGLGYQDGPIERLERGGLAHHYEVTQSLFETFGTPAYAPSRRAVVAHQRNKSQKKKT